MFRQLFKRSGVYTSWSKQTRREMLQQEAIKNKGTRLFAPPQVNPSCLFRLHLSQFVVLRSFYPQIPLLERQLFARLRQKCVCSASRTTTGGIIGSLLRMYNFLFSAASATATRSYCNVGTVECGGCRRGCRGRYCGETQQGRPLCWAYLIYTSFRCQAISRSSDTSISEFNFPTSGYRR